MEGGFRRRAMILVGSRGDAVRGLRGSVGVAGLGFLCLLASAGCPGPREAAPLPDDLEWPLIVERAQGRTVRMAMWDGDPMINAYMRDYVVPEMRRRYGVSLEMVGAQGAEIVSRLVVDRETGRRSGDLDVCWINGESFYQLRRIDALYGPFTDRLPHGPLVDWNDPFIAFDFQQPIQGYECPWGNVQLTLIYNSDTVAQPPRTRDQLARWIQDHPGRFTFDNGFTGMTFLKSLLHEFAGGGDALQGAFDERTYTDATRRLWAWLRALQPYLWRKGETFPPGVAQLHQLFRNGEVDFTMSNNDGEVDNKVSQGVLPESARAYVLDSGTIRNSHYLGIPRNASEKAAALVLVNFLISPEAQLRKATPTVWGDGTILDLEKLPEPWRARFQELPGRTRVPGREQLKQRALMEPAPELMIRLHEDFRREIVERVR